MKSMGRTAIAQDGFNGLRRAARVVLGLSLAVCMSAVDRNYFVGNWVNLNHGTRSLKAVQIGMQDNRYFVRAWGACSPTPCKWGMARVSFFATGVSSNDVTTGQAVYRPGFSVERMTLRPGGNGTLIVEVMTHFTDNSGRSDYSSVDTLRQVPWNQWDSNIYN